MGRSCCTDWIEGLIVNSYLPTLEGTSCLRGVDRNGGNG